MSKSTAESLEQIEARLVKEAVAKATAQAKAEAEKQWGEQNKNFRTKVEHLAKELNVSGPKELITLIQSVFGLSGKVAKGSKKSSGEKRHRTTITPEIEAQIKSLHKQGKKAPAIATELGIAYPTVLKRLK